MNKSAQKVLQKALDSNDIQSLFRYAFTLCQHKENAEDLVQSSLEIFFKQLEQGNIIQNPLAFSRTVIRNRFIDQYRSKLKREEELFEEQTEYDISPVDLEGIVVNQLTLEHIWAQLDLLERDILYHWAILGLSTDEAAQELDIPRGTFLSRIHRLRKKLSSKNPATVKTPAPHHTEGS